MGETPALDKTKYCRICIGRMKYNRSMVGIGKGAECYGISTSLKWSTVVFWQGKNSTSTYIPKSGYWYSNHYNLFRVFDEYSSYGISICPVLYRKTGDAELPHSRLAFWNISSYLFPKENGPDTIIHKDIKKSRMIFFTGSLQARMCNGGNWQFQLKKIRDPEWPCCFNGEDKKRVVFDKLKQEGKVASKRVLHFWGERLRNTREGLLPTMKANLLAMGRLSKVMVEVGGMKVRNAIDQVRGRKE